MLIHIDLEFTINDKDAPEKQVRELCDYIIAENPVQKNIENALALIEPLIGWNTKENGNLLPTDAETILAILDAGFELDSIPQFIINNRLEK